jgi:hypothetical protein
MIAAILLRVQSNYQFVDCEAVKKSAVETADGNACYMK